MRSAKILTTEKRHILEKLTRSSDTRSAMEPDYFHLGDPLLDRPTLRGSMVLALNEGFLLDNKRSFLYGSPMDVGGLRFGFINPPGDRSRLLQLVQCDAYKFFAFLSALAEVPNEARLALFSHRPHEAVRAIISDVFGHEVSQSMFTLGDDPHAWLFEYALRPDYILKPEHVSSLWCPNTYKNTDSFRTLRRLLSGRIHYYNPKYGLEACCGK
ncbi:MULTISPECIES: hypothetical protein [Acidithiobacillus]|jgi:hypothetical protein|uniref:Uncharacterized protein n=1 Tax=Acidithiobacillus ferrivorans TaxID=160808 RepID=A0A7T5BI78_9PROT|nr:MULTISPECIES: hypothetical protein [Acidithiobacillus]MEB8534633.1 hypothetical protein [Acidithiobacillus ferriphilus]QQD73008.1 hypothetical protein H2515_01315 [Acidithiobacillus ferrivorans]